MEQERKDQVIRVAALSGVSFAVIIGIPGIQNRNRNPSVKKQDLGQYAEVISTFGGHIEHVRRIEDGQEPR